MVMLNLTREQCDDIADALAQQRAEMRDAASRSTFARTKAALQGAVNSSFDLSEYIRREAARAADAWPAVVIMVGTLRGVDLNEEFWHAVTVFSEEIPEPVRHARFIRDLNARTQGWAGPYSVRDLEPDGRVCWSSWVLPVIPASAT